MTPHTTATHRLQPSLTWLRLKRMIRRKYKRGRENIDTLKLPVPWVYMLGLWKSAFPEMWSFLISFMPQRYKIMLTGKIWVLSQIGFSSHKNQQISWRFNKVHIHTHVYQKFPKDQDKLLVIYISSHQHSMRLMPWWRPLMSVAFWNNPCFVKNLYAHTVGP